MTLQAIEESEAFIDPEPLKTYEASSRRLRHDLRCLALARGLCEVKSAFSGAVETPGRHGGLN